MKIEEDHPTETQTEGIGESTGIQPDMKIEEIIHRVLANGVLGEFRTQSIMRTISYQEEKGQWVEVGLFQEQDQGKQKEVNGDQLGIKPPQLKIGMRIFRSL